MNLIVKANLKGSAPVYGQTITIEGHASGVDITVPHAEGTLSKESAVEFAHAILTAAGGKVGAAVAPTKLDFAGTTLRGDTSNGFELFDASGVSIRIFKPVLEVVKYA